MRIVPQFVVSTATYVRLRLSLRLAFFALGDLGSGAATASHPSRAERGGIAVVAVLVAVVAAGAVAVVVLSLSGSSLPHASSATAASRMTIRTVARRT